VLWVNVKASSVLLSDQIILSISILRYFGVHLSLPLRILLGGQAFAQLDGDGPSPASEFDFVTDFPGGEVPAQGSTFGDATGEMLNQVNISEPIIGLFLQAEVHFAEFNISGTGSTGQQTEFFNSEINISSGSLGQETAFSTNIISDAEFNDSFVSVTGGTLGNNAELLSGSTLVLDSGTVGQDIESEVGSTIEVNGGEFSTTRPFVVDGVFNFTDGVVGDRGNFNSNSTLNMSGGTLGGLGNPGNSANVFGVANFSGGTIAPRFDAEAGSTVNITGGDFGLDFDAFGTVNMSGGTIYTVNLTGGLSLDDGITPNQASFDAHEGSTVNISGGDIGQFFDAMSGSVVDITGGNFGRDFDCEAGCLVTISGGDFETDFSTDGDADVTISGGTFAGFFLNQGSVLADGSEFSFVLDTTVPEVPDGGSGDFFGAGSTVSVTLIDTPDVLLGDVDLSGEVDFRDIVPFIALLSGNTFQAEADIDESGVVDFRDIVPFIRILSQP